MLKRGMCGLPLADIICKSPERECCNSVSFLLVLKCALMNVERLLILLAHAHKSRLELLLKLAYEHLVLWRSRDHTQATGLRAQLVIDCLVEYNPV